MQLLIDIGNSRTKYCCYDKGEFEQYRSLKNKDFARRIFYILPKKVSHVFVSCVHHGKPLEAIEQWANKLKINCQVIKSTACAFGVTSGYQNPEQLGVDRWLALVGIAKKYPEQNCIIVDSGTATTIDILNAQGEHQGGWIIPGIHTMVKSLLQRTSQVKVEVAQVTQLGFEKNTQDNVNAGALAATLGAITLAKQQLEQQGLAYQLIIGGGSGKILRQYLAPNSYQFEANVVFLGLSCYADSV